MAGMFPTMLSHPDDANRRSSAGQAGDEWPRPLQIGFYLICAASVLMLLSAMTLLSQGLPDGIDESLRGYFMTNMRVAAFGNIILAVLLVSAASFFRQGSRSARRWASVFIGLALFLNLAAFLTKVLSLWAAMSIVIVLAFGLFFTFRPDSNAFVDKMSPRF